MCGGASVTSLKRYVQPSSQHFRTKQRTPRWGQERDTDGGRDVLEVRDVVRFAPVWFLTPRVMLGTQHTLSKYLLTGCITDKIMTCELQRGLFEERD